MPVPVRHLLADLLGLLFPRRCGACQRVLPPGDAGLCPDCSLAAIGLVDQPYCNLCGQDVGPFALRPTRQAGVEVCGQCDSSLYRYEALVRVGPFVEPLDGMIRRFKYGGAQHLSAILGQWQSARLSAQPWLPKVDALVPVPLHWRRRMGRGYNQSEMLAEWVARQVGKPVVGAISRVVHRPPQASLPRSQRFENVRGVFSVRRPKHVRGRRFCLIDDVCTTGATLSEAARTLLGAGAECVYAAVVAVAQPPPAYSQSLRDPV